MCAAATRVQGRFGPVPAVAGHSTDTAGRHGHCKPRYGSGTGGLLRSVSLAAFMCSQPPVGKILRSAPLTQLSRISAQLNKIIVKLNIMCKIVYFDVHCVFKPVVCVCVGIGCAKNLSWPEN